MTSRFALTELEFVWDQDQDQRTVKSDTPVGQQTLTAFGDDVADMGQRKHENPTAMNLHAGFHMGTTINSLHP